MMDYSLKFKYDENSPSGLVAVKPRSGSKNWYVGYINSNGYWEVYGVAGKYVVAHKVVMALHGEFPLEGQEIDHIDGNKLNNKRENLRIVDKAVNMRNKGKNKANTSGVNGIKLNRKKHPPPHQDKISEYYQAVVYVDGKQKTKHFSIEKYGKDAAMQLAIEWRQKMIDDLNEQGAGYTSRHGSA